MTLVDHLPFLLRLAGIGQLGILVASALVPGQLKWRETFAVLPTLHRQMAWVYAGYVVYSIVFLGLVTLICADDFASGSRLAKWVCGYGLLFWGIRLGLQPVFDVKKYLTAWWLTAGYHLLTVLFVGFVVVYGMVIFAT
jgi:hypothetical protein